MQCPKCDNVLEKISINEAEVFKCPGCGGIWFNKNSLQKIKDERDGDLKWVDIDLWNDSNNLELDEGGFMNCPNDGSRLFKVKCCSSDVITDICLDCYGIWLDKGELDKILRQLEEKINSETLPEYLKDLENEFKDLLLEKGNSGKEIRNIFIIMKLIEYRLAAQYPKITEITSVLPD